MALRCLRLVVPALAALALSACAAMPRTERGANALADAPAAGARPLGESRRVPGETLDQLYAIAWTQSALEYEATTRSVYAAARRRLAPLVAAHQLAARADAPAAERQAALNQLTAWNAMPLAERLGDDVGQPLAIVVDVDETVLDNSPYQARLVREDAEYGDASWFAWSEERAARPVPGALEFAQWAGGAGITIWYVTNRKQPLCAATADNLRQQGFPLREDASNLMCRDDARGWTSAKGSRRVAVDRTSHVIAVFGDNLGDFIDGVYATPEARKRLAATYRDWWGDRWYMLPNPMYGSWVDAALAACGADAPGRRECLKRVLRER